MVVSDSSLISVVNERFLLTPRQAQGQCKQRNTAEQSGAEQRAESRE